MDITNAIENLQNTFLDFSLDYYIEPSNLEEYTVFLNYCRENNINLFSGKDMSSIPKYNDENYNRIKFVIIKNKKGYFLTYELYHFFRHRKRIELSEFLSRTKNNDNEGDQAC